MGGPTSSTTSEIYMQAHENIAISTALHHSKVWERSVDDVYSILKCTHLFTMDEESNGELSFLGILLKQNNGKITVLLYTKPTHTDQYLHYSSHPRTSNKKSAVSSFSTITNKDY